MTNWIKDSSGRYVNLDHAIRIEPEGIGTYVVHFLLSTR